MYPDRATRPPVPYKSYLAIEERGDAAPRRLSIVGDLDVATAPALAKRLDQMQEDKVDVRLDLSDLHFIDSTGIRVLLTTAYHARDDSRWKFEVEGTLDPVVRHTLRLAKVEDFILGEHHGRARDPAPV